MSIIRLQDEICPGYIGTQLITLSLAQPEEAPRAFRFVLIDVDYSAADEVGGIVLPLEVMVTAPTMANFDRTYLERVASVQIGFLPVEGGRHLVTLREVAHNRAYGTLVVDVAGDVTDPLQSLPRELPTT